ncbi:hypothetical protein HNQ60_004222 [Povalibacter uvarum]|uniref:YCII-related domain-containing protein n=1 Tax=Povalibacter uvarum TaxID=732238 RepID=A0A841HTL6_9GAMM|nr:YciI family protein [Povalibacter uvarum]MBB6095332.1 hypothetical protein [Povalibacter uvarum]
MRSFFVLFHETPRTLTEMSPTQMQEVIARYRTWFDRVHAAGHIGVRAKLKDDGGKHLNRERAAIVASDGPFVEAKDVISGVFVLNAASHEAAQALLADCPHFDFGWMEVREIDFIKQ